MQNKPVTIVVAVSENGVMGKDNDLPWKIPTDMRHFQTTTRGGAMVMGRKTADSFGGKPLPGRFNLVVSKSHPASSLPSAGEGKGTYLYFNSLDAAFNFAQAQDVPGVFLIGGAELFKQGMDRVDKIVLTRVLAMVDGDTFFPSLDEKEWIMEETLPMETGPNDQYPCRIEVYMRRS